jgi:hypothetical protein
MAPKGTPDIIPIYSCNTDSLLLDFLSGYSSLFGFRVSVEYQNRYWLSGFKRYLSTFKSFKSYGTIVVFQGEFSSAFHSMKKTMTIRQ